MRKATLYSSRMLLSVYFLVSSQSAWAMSSHALSDMGSFPLKLDLKSEPSTGGGSVGEALYQLDVETREIKVLIRIVANNFGGFIWSFVKRRIDSNETMQATAKREVLEEMGVDSRIQDWLIDQVGYTTITRFYIGTKSGEITFGFESTETTRVALVSTQDVRQILNKGRDRRVLAALELTLQRAQR